MGFKVEFRKSEKIFEWEENFVNLPDFADAKGVQIESNCRIGVCGSCKVKMISGKVVMDTEDALEETDREENRILLVATPKSDLLIDA